MVDKRPDYGYIYPMEDGDRTMRCDICKRREAAIRFAEIRKGTMRVRNICESCARSTGIADQLERTIAAVGGALSDVLAPLAGEDAGTAACPACGMTIEEFRRHGHLGCERCYQSFAVLLLPLLERLHDLSGQPGGTVPDAGRRRRTDHRRQGLEQRLEEAVAAEEYELAARLRDELKALAAGPDGAHELPATDHRHER